MLDEHNTSSFITIARTWPTFTPPSNSSSPQPPSARPHSPSPNSQSSTQHDFSFPIIPHPQDINTLPNHTFPPKMSLIPCIFSQIHTPVSNFMASCIVEKCHRSLRPNIGHFQEVCIFQRPTEAGHCYQVGQVTVLLAAVGKDPIVMK